MLTADLLTRISGEPLSANARSVIAGFARYGVEAGLDRPHRLAIYIAQLAHESAAFVYDQEIASGRAYEGRADLVNTQPGDGVRFKGRTAMMLTGRANYAAFDGWCAGRFPDAPDFVANPDAVNADPWEGLVPIWYWVTRDLNVYCDRGDFEMVTRRINGGLNGLADRLHWYVRAALVILGRAPDDVRGFQEAMGLAVDGIAGPRTRAALHAALVRARAPVAAVGAKSDRPRSSVAETTTGRLSAAQIAAGLGTAVASLTQLDGELQKILVLGGLVLAGMGLVIFRERLKHFVAGVR